MFKITHFANSFINIESDSSMITCDPWIGKTTSNGWFSYPIQNKGKIDKKYFDSDFIYISHLHCDHFDIKTLKKFKNKKLTFLIKKFDNATLKKRLQKITNNIIELDPFKKKIINKDFTVAIIPQIISNSKNLSDNINYDLDTSIIIQSNKDKTIFYNNVDNVLNLKILKKIKNFVKKEFNKSIDIFCYPIGAASEFPQCFLNLNRKKEKKKVIEETLKDASLYVKYLKPQFFFPAGGTYMIYGKYHKLNKYIAKPNFLEIKNKISSSQTKVSDLIGGGSICFNQKSYTVIEKNFKKLKNFETKFLNKIKNIKYYYSSNINKIDLKNLDNIFDNAKKNYFKIFTKKINTDVNWNFNFKIYKNFEINDNCLIDSKKSILLKTYMLKNKTCNTKKEFKLECNLEYNLFKSLINGKFPWNTSLSGSTIMYKRKPNIFNVDMVFSLNFLRI